MTRIQMLTSRLRLLRPGAFVHWCPACMCSHVLEIGSVQADEKRLGFDGDYERPTFEPEVVQQHPNGRVCKYLIRGGVLTYSTSCTHDLAGKTFELPHFPLT